MTPAESARENAISFECKKDALQQRQSGDWKISFTVQGIDMDERITRAPMGTRFIAVLVAINDDELPITPAEKGKAKSTNQTAPKLQPDTSDKPRPAGVGREKRSWNEMKPSAQAAMRCDEPIFWAYLNEEHGYRIANKEEAAAAVRDKCGVTTRAHLDRDGHHASLMIWHQLSSGYIAWKALEHA